MTTIGTLDPGVAAPGGDGDAARPRRVDVELVVAGSLLLAVTAGGLWFMARPGPTPLDRWASVAVPAVHHSGALVALTRLGSPAVVVAGSVVGFLATFRRDRPRSVALLVGPVLAVLACNWALKPVVGRTFADVVSFPSGTVAAVAALAVAGVLAAPTTWRWVAYALGAPIAVLSAVSVVALRWHYPTDALAGLATGAGVVLLVDCTTRRVAARHTRTRRFRDTEAHAEAKRSPTG